MKYFPLRLFLCLSFVCSTPVFSKANEAQSYTRSDLVARALSNNPLIHAAEAELEVFEAKLRYTERWWVPRLRVDSLITALPGEWGNALEGGTDFGEWGPYSRTDATIGMPLYTFGKVSSLKEMAKAGVDISKAKQDLARRTVESYVDQAFTAVLLGRDLLELLEEGKAKVATARDRLETLDEEDSEDFEPTDMQRLKLVEVELDERRLEAEAVLDQGLIALRLLARLEPSDPVHTAQRLKDYVPLLADSEEAAVVLARAHRVEFKALQAALRASQSAVSYAKASLLPNLILGGFVRYAFAPSADDQASPFAYDPFNIFTGGAGLMLNWNLDVPKSMMLIDEAGARKRQLLAQQRALYGKTEMDVRKVWKRVERADTMRKLARKGTKAARGWLVVKSDSFEAGLATFGDVAKAVRAYYERRIKEISASYEIALARVKLAETLGLNFQ
jgi:outer membrane protein TolC